MCRVLWKVIKDKSSNLKVAYSLVGEIKHIWNYTTRKDVLSSLRVTESAMGAKKRERLLPDRSGKDKHSGNPTDKAYLYSNWVTRGDESSELECPRSCPWFLRTSRGIESAMALLSLCSHVGCAHRTKIQAEKSLLFFPSSRDPWSYRVEEEHNTKGCQKSNNQFQH